MTIANLLRFTVHGSGNGEEWLFGFTIGHGAAVTSEATLSTILDGWNTLNTNDTTPSTYGNLCSLIGTDQKIDTLSAYAYADAALPATYLHHKTVNVVGTGGTFAPLQQSLVATLNTARSGASYRGRMYLPANGIAPSTGHLISSGFVTTALKIAAGITANACITARGTEVGDSARVVVYSRTKGSIADVTTVSVDNRLDTQRRRATKQAGVTRTSGVGPNP